MWFLQNSEELSNVVPAKQRSYLIWFLRIAEELSNVVAANRRGAM